MARRMEDDRGRFIQFRRALHRCQFPMVLVDNERRYLDANRAARLLFRLSLAELRRRRIDDMTPPVAHPRMEALWASLLSQGEISGDYDVRFEDASQLRIVFFATANVLPGEHLIVFAPALWPEGELGAPEAAAGRPVTGPLSAREREVLVLISEGMSLAEIAESLTISIATVRSHAGNSYRKLGARNRTHAVTLALRHRVIDPE